MKKAFSNGVPGVSPPADPPQGNATNLLGDLRTAVNFGK